MRTLSTNIDEALIKGLSPDERLLRGAPYLSKAKNVKVSERGLEPYDPIVDPFKGMKKVEYPFPQLFRGEYHTLLCDKSNIYLVDETTWDFRDLRSIDLSGNNKVIKEGGPWHFLDMKDVFFLFNGETVIWSDATQKLKGNDKEIFVSDKRKINTGTHHRGRAVIGGFNPKNFWGDKWEFIFDSWRDQIDQAIDLPTDDIDSNYVMWGSIGGGDFPLWLYKPGNYPEGLEDSYMTGDEYDLGNASHSLFIEMLKKNMFGFMPMPWQGEVLNIKSLGSNLVVYGDEGITILVQANSEMASTFGVKHVLSTGIASRSAVGGTENGHLFVDREGSIWMINAEGQPQRLGYDQFGYDLLGEDIIVTYNPEENEYYICSKNKSFMFKDEGLTEIGQHITSQEFVQGGQVGIFNEKEFEKDVEIVTHPKDLGVRGIKTITNLNLGIRGGKDVKVGIEYRYNSDDEFQRSKMYPLNKEGVAFIRYSGVDFRFVVTSKTFEGFELDYIQVSFQKSDKRYSRGINASQVSS